MRVNNLFITPEAVHAGAGLEPTPCTPGSGSEIFCLPTANSVDGGVCLQTFPDQPSGRGLIHRAGSPAWPLCSPCLHSPSCPENPLTLTSCHPPSNPSGASGQRTQIFR